MLMISTMFLLHRRTSDSVAPKLVVTKPDARTHTPPFAAGVVDSTNLRSGAHATCKGSAVNSPRQNSKIKRSVSDERISTATQSAYGTNGGGASGSSTVKIVGNSFSRLLGQDGSVVALKRRSVPTLPGVDNETSTTVTAQAQSMRVGSEGVAQKANYLRAGCCGSEPVLTLGQSSSSSKVHPQHLSSSSTCAHHSTQPQQQQHPRPPFGTHAFGTSEPMLPGDAGRGDCVLGGFVSFDRILSLPDNMKELAMLEDDERRCQEACNFDQQYHRQSEPEREGSQRSVSVTVDGQDGFFDEHTHFMSELSTSSLPQRGNFMSELSTRSLAHGTTSTDSVGFQFSRRLRKKLSINVVNLVDSVTTPILSPSSGRRSQPPSLAKRAEKVSPKDDGEDEAHFAVYRVVVVAKISTGQLMYKYKTSSKNEVVLKLSLRGLAVLERHTRRTLHEYSYRQLTAITLKDTGKEHNMRVIVFEFGPGEAPSVVAFASFQCDEIVTNVKSLLRKGRYAGFLD